MRKIKQPFLLFFVFTFLCPLLFANQPEVNSAASQYEKGVSFLKQDQYDAAIEAFQKALETEKGAGAQARIYNLIGLAYMKQGVSVSSAIGSFEQAIKLDPQFAESYFNIASAYSENNLDPQKAVQYFRKTIEVDPKYTKAYFGLGWFTLMQEDNAAQAIDYFQKTLDQFPDFAEALYGKGLAYIRIHKPYMALGMVSQLRGIQRDDLASVLEKSITEVSPPQEATPVTAQKSSDVAAVSPAEGEAASQESVQKPRGKSPFEAMLRGKRAR